MHLLFDVSAHGLGHLAQAAPVINALAARHTDLQLTIRSALSHAQIARRVIAEFHHVAEARDFGFVMHNAVDIDLQSSARVYREFHANWQERILQEAQWLDQNGIDAVVTNVAYLPLAAAAKLGLPAASMCSLNWADLFWHYFAPEPWAAAIHRQMLSAYLDADCFLRLTPGLPMHEFHHAHPIGPIAHIGSRRRMELSHSLGIDKRHRWILLAMGGMDFPIPIQSWTPVSGTTWLVPRDWSVHRPDVISFDDSGLDFSDILASVDAVVTKPGYGTFVEAACSGLPLLYVQRADWPETTHFAKWLGVHARSAEISREQLSAGNFLEAVQRLWQMAQPPIPRASGVAEALHHLSDALRLDKKKH